MTDLALAVSVVAGNTATKVTVTATADPATTYTLYRVREDTGAQTQVLGAYQIPVAGTVWDDPAAELDVPIHYVAVLSTGETVESASVLLIVGYPVLSIPHRGLQVSVTIADEGRDKVRKSRATVLEVEGRPDPIVVWDVRGAETRAPVLLVRTRDELQAVRDIFASGEPVLLRAPCPTIEDFWFISVDSITEAPVRRSSWAHLVTISQALVVPEAPESWLRSAGDTLGDLATAVPGTLADIAATWATLGDIAAADLGAL